MEPEEHEPRPFAPRTRALKPTATLDPDARRLLARLVEVGVGLELVASLAKTSESTVRRCMAGVPGARASICGVALAVVVAVCRAAPELVPMERATLARIARDHTPDGVGLALAEIMDTPSMAPPMQPRPRIALCRR